MSAGENNLRCPLCVKPSPHIQTRSGIEKKSWYRIAAEWILIFIPIIGWAILIYSSVTDASGHLAATCQKCGHNWFLTKTEVKILKNPR